VGKPGTMMVEAEGRGREGEGKYGGGLWAVSLSSLWYFCPDCIPSPPPPLPSRLTTTVVNIDILL